MKNQVGAYGFRKLRSGDDLLRVEGGKGKKAVFLPWREVKRLERHIQGREWGSEKLSRPGTTKGRGLKRKNL